jgi:hypothetical protein
MSDAMAWLSGNFVLIVLAAILFAAGRDRRAKPR